MHLTKHYNDSGELLTMNQICSLANLGEGTVRRLAEEAGAAVKIGKCYRINRKKFFQYVEKEYSV